MKHWQTSTALASIGMFLIAAPVFADDINPSELVNLSLEQLSNIEVTSVSKKSEKANEAAAAIYVITQDDIRRSGATSIPDLLRMVPGLDVAQSGSHQWSVSSRGFNDQFSNKLLVLIDGRSVYTPLYSGVFWDVQDTPLQDIERIEVIRGPGATQWGANAVNGVINIITKDAKDTQGGFVSETAGNQINSQTTVREGAKIGDDSYARVYAKYDDYAAFKNMSGNDAHDAWDKEQSGFRADIKPATDQTITFQGDIYRGGESYLLNLPAAFAPDNAREIVSGGNLLTKWDDKLSATADVSLQMYYDDARRSNVLYDSNLQTFAADLQHSWSPFQGHDIVWGAGYSLVQSDVEGNTPYITYTPESRSDNLFSAFVQDKITLHPDDVFLTLGSKFEHNDYTGFEFQPSARLSWLVDSKQTLWSSVSRAVRTPNISTSDSQLIITPLPTPPFPATTYAAQTGTNTQSEELIAYEVGYRVEPTKNTSVDISTFYNDYNRLLIGVLGPVTGPSFSTVLGIPYFLQPILPVNMGTAHSWGEETSAKWSPMDNLELAAGYSLEELKFDQPDPYGYNFAGKSPQQQFNARAALKLPHNVEWDSAVYYVDSLTSVDPNTGLTIPKYTRVDTRLAWDATNNIELSLVGQNLLDNLHQEFKGFLYQDSSQVPRSFYGNVTIKF